MINKSVMVKFSIDPEFFAVIKRAHKSIVRIGDAINKLKNKQNRDDTRD